VTIVLIMGADVVLGMGNRATVYALHLEYSGANFATAEFPCEWRVDHSI
jgi:hypothetical protein